MEIKEFKPYIFTGDINEAVSPPFDTITPELMVKLRSKRNNIIDLSINEKNINPVQLLGKWLSEGIIKQYPENTILILRQKFNFNKEIVSRYGIISLMKLNEHIKDHEYTFSQQVSERKRVMEALKGQIEPIFIVIADNNFDKMVRRFAQSLECKINFEEPVGVDNNVYFLIDDEKIEKLKAAVYNSDGIIADGHHRGTAIRDLYKTTGDNFWEYAISYITSIYDAGLMIGGVDRLVYGLNFETSIPAIKNFFDLVEEKSISDNNIIQIYSNGKFYSLKPKKYIIDELFREAPLSTEIVNTILFKEVYKLKDEEIEKKVGFIYNVTDAINAVDSHECNFAIIIPQWQKDVFLKLVFDNKVLPQKSTYFYPKIPSGIALYLKPP